MGVRTPHGQHLKKAGPVKICAVPRATKYFIEGVDPWLASTHQNGGIRVTRPARPPRIVERPPLRRDTGAIDFPQEIATAESHRLDDLYVPSAAAQMTIKSIDYLISAGTW